MPFKRNINCNINLSGKLIKFIYIKAGSYRIRNVGQEGNEIGVVEGFHVSGK